MKKILLIAALCAVLPRTAGAQVRKEVEVTKEYIPSVEQAPKLPIAPDMTDTTQMRPEIAYAVSPFALNSPLELQPIHPTTVTFWNFNRPELCYLKAGAGYPLNSALDFHVATQHPNTGYALGYIHHEGRYADIRNDFDLKNKSMRMFNRAGAAAGKYIGKHIIEAAASYENRLSHRYGAYIDPSIAGWFPVAPGARVDYGDADFAFRIGDDFQDLSRVNFELAAQCNLFFDQSVWTSNDNRPRQTTLHASGKLARAFGRHRFSLEAGYDRYAGHRSITALEEHVFRGSIRYGAETRMTNFEVGLDYYRDRISGTKDENYFLPFVRLSFNLGTKKIRPFLDVDGSFRANDYRSLTRQCPYVTPATLQNKRSVDYKTRLGISGNLWRERLAYRLYAAFSLNNDHNYWYSTGIYDAAAQRVLAAALTLQPAQARQTVTSFHGEAEFHPVNALRIELGLHANLYNDNLDFGNGVPKFEGNFGIRYSVKQISFGVSLAGQTAQKWTLLYTDIVNAPETDETGTESSDIAERGTFKVPATMNLQATFDWRISQLVGIFVEGDNLLNHKLYRQPWYPEYGANFTLGVKLAF